MEARRVLARRWRGAEAAWRRAPTAGEEDDRLESAWAQSHAALDSFAPCGRLNNRGRTEAEIAAALGDLAGPELSKTRNFLGDLGSLAFLDRMHCRLAVAELDRGRSEAMAWRWP